MKERPILFSGPMVRALLDGRKTQTRRVVKPAIAEALNFLGGRADEAPATGNDVTIEWGPSEDDDGKTVPAQWLARCAEYPEEGVIPIGTAYGQPGDRLWVRETCSIGGNGYFYRADVPQPETVKYAWIPSIHMRREASRITLEITDVRVERLHEISRLDCFAEGWPADARQLEQVWQAKAAGVGDDGVDDASINWYADLWETLNGPDSWDANPWVWVVEFKRL